jgi:hypothetical protein
VGVSEVIQADRPARADVRKDLVVKKSKAHTHFTWSLCWASCQLTFGDTRPKSKVSKTLPNDPGTRSRSPNFAS